MYVCTCMRLSVCLAVCMSACLLVHLSGSLRILADCSIVMVTEKPCRSLWRCCRRPTLNVVDCKPKECNEIQLLNVFRLVSSRSRSRRRHKQQQQKSSSHPSVVVVVKVFTQFVRLLRNVGVVSNVQTYVRAYVRTYERTYDTYTCIRQRLTNGCTWTADNVMLIVN